MLKALIAILFAVCCVGTAGAVGSMADLSIYDTTEGRTLPVYYYDGRHYIAGKPGNEYEVSIRSRQARPLLTVLSVDGVNAVSGETADWSGAGYVLSEHASYSIKGWRKSTQRVARFFFTEPGNSYASRTGRPDQVGVIGVALFRPKSERLPGVTREFRSRDDSPAAPRSSGAPAPVQKSEAPADFSAPNTRLIPSEVEQALGTGHGRSAPSPVRYASFDRASPTPDEIIAIYYDSYPNLVARGIIREAPRAARPRPFPGQFVPDPS